MKTLFKLFAIAALVNFSFSSCFKVKDNAPEENDNEVITTVEVHLTEQGTTKEQIFAIDYPDGFGAGAAPTKDTIKLEANKIYNAQILLLDKTKTPVDTSSNEVQEENIDHRFYFLPASGTNITVSNLDTDANGIPVGLHSTWTTGARAAGQIQITLRHYAEGGKAADDPVTSTKSSTDIEVVYDTKVE